MGNIVGKTLIQPYFVGFLHAITISLFGTGKTSPLLQAPFCWFGLGENPLGAERTPRMQQVAS